MTNDRNTGSASRKPLIRCTQVVTPRFIAIGFLALLTCGLFLLRERPLSSESERSDANLSHSNSVSSPDGRLRSARWQDDRGRTPQEIVAGKVVEFGRNRRAIVERLSAHHGKDLPPGVAEFFDAIERGQWEEIERTFQPLAKRSGQFEGSTHDPALNPFWPAVLETYGAAEQAHLWPAKELLEYGEAILGSLRPGMVYVGGTDPGRFIPTLINETSSGEQHIVLTQNALADSRYLDYIHFLYDDRLTLPSAAEAEGIYGEYKKEALKRFEHDQQFPDEPKQIRRHENIKVEGDAIELSGRDAVFTVNDRLIQSILEKNPELAFALEESIPIKSTYEGAAPLGPIFELRSNAPEESVSTEQANSALAYWREMSWELSGGSNSSSEEALKIWSKMIVSQGNLFAHQNHPAQAEQAYRLATDLYPRNTDAILSYSEYLLQNGRSDAARQVVNDYARQNPDLKKDLDRFLPPELRPH